MRTIRIVNYTGDGGGIGRLNRLIAVSRWIRRYAAHSNAPAEIYFLTSSEADGILFTERMASFKVPSLVAASESGIDKTSYLALAKQWIWHSLALLRPDVFIVDSFPRGAFGELLSALDLAGKRVFIYRPVNADIASRPDFQAMLPLYEAILVPEYEDIAPVLVPEVAKDRVRHVGPIMIREEAEA